MYKTYQEALEAAMDVINRIYGGDKCGCCVTENKQTKRARYVRWNFRFHSEDSNGQFIQNSDGSYSRLYKI